MKLKTYELHWVAEIYGVQIVQAFDEEDATEQFNSELRADELGHMPISAVLEHAQVVLPEKKKRKKK